MGGMSATGNTLWTSLLPYRIPGALPFGHIFFGSTGIITPPSTTLFNHLFIYCSFSRIYLRSSCSPSKVVGVNLEISARMLYIYIHIYNEYM